MSFAVAIQPVDLAQEVVLPNPWPQLEESGFHPDILLRARGYLLQAERLGMQEQAREFLRMVGEGFATPFDSSEFAVSEDDSQRAVKEKALEALSVLSEQFGSRVSSVVWKTLAFLATRKNATEYSTILASKDELPFGWWMADTVLHALGKVYGFKMHVDTVFCAQTGMLLEHNCDCGCDIHPAGEGTVNALLKESRWELATAALFSHMAGEFLLITGLKMPFEMGLSPEAAEVMALT